MRFVSSLGIGCDIYCGFSFTWVPRYMAIFYLINLKNPNGERLIDLGLIDNDIYVLLREMGWHEMHLAAASGNKEVVMFLLAKGHPLGVQEINYYTPLHLAAWNGHLDVVKYLLREGANPNSEGIDLEHAEDENVWDEDDENYEIYTPLHLAAYRGYTSVVDCLLRHGARVGITSGWQNTPYT